MNADAVLTEKIAQLRTRVRLLVMHRWMIRALLAAVIVCLLAAVVMRWTRTLFPVEWLPVLLAVAAIVGAAIGWTRPVSAMDAARLADQRMALRERLSSGLEFSGSLLSQTPVARRQAPGEEEFLDAQIQDAAAHSARLRPGVVFPYRLPREGRWLVAACLALAALIVLPELPVFQSPRDRAERAAMRREGKKLERLAKETLQRKGQSNAEVSRRVAENMRRLGIQMQRGRVDKKGAMLRASRLTRELKDAQRQLAQGRGSKPLSQSAAELRRAAADPRFAKGSQAGKMMASMAEALSKRDMDAAAKALQELADRLKRGEKLSQAEMDAMAAALKRMAASMANSDLDAASKQLQDAARQLEAASKLAAIDPSAEAELRRLLVKVGDKCSAAGGT